MTESISHRVQRARAPGGRRRYAQVARYASAFVAPTCAFALQSVVARQVPATPALFFCPAVLVAAILGGSVPGLIATALSVFIIADRFLPPRATMSAGAWALHGGIELVIFAGLSVTICFLVERSRAIRRAVREATQEAREANRARSAVLGIVSHELGNALNTIHLSARMLRRFDEATARIDTAAQRIERNARLATRLLDDIRDAAAIDAGCFGLRRSMVRLASVLDETLDALRPQAEAKEITLVADLGTTRSLSCDRDRIAQVAANLLGNAIKFTPAGGTVSLGLLEKDGHLVVIVEDSGPGIDEALWPKVFEPFWRGTADESGTGLGLYIARTIVEAHGGTLRVGRCLSGGAIFTVALPIGAAGSPACVMTCAPVRES